MIMDRIITIYYKTGQKHIITLPENFTLKVTNNTIKIVKGIKSDYYLLSEIESFEVSYKVQNGELEEQDE